MMVLPCILFLLVCSKDCKGEGGDRVGVGQKAMLRHTQKPDLARTAVSKLRPVVPLSLPNTGDVARGNSGK